MAGAIIPLLTAHLLVDFLLWPRQGRMRAGWADVVGHAGLYAGVGYLLLGRWQLWWMLVLLLVYDVLLRDRKSVV